MYRWKNQNWKGRVVSSCRRRRRNSEPLIIPDTLKRVKIEGNEVSQGSGGDPPGKPAKLAVNVQHIMKDTQICISKVRREYAYICTYSSTLIKYVRTYVFAPPICIEVFFSPPYMYMKAKKPHRVVSGGLPPESTAPIHGRPMKPESTAPIHGRPMNPESTVPIHGRPMNPESTVPTYGGLPCTASNADGPNHESSGFNVAPFCGTFVHNV